MIKKIITLISIVLSAFTISAQNNLCSNPTPFCTGQTMQFPAGVNAGQAQAGPNYGCLGSQPNPAWFYFQAATSGPMVITMAAANDIDFICWGPFPSLNSCGNLTSATQVPGSGYSNPSSNGCSYSGSATETLTIQNAVPGQYYIMLITNFSNQNQQITFQQQNSNVPGAGQTNCGVLCSMSVTATNSLCAGATATLGVTTGTQIVSVHWAGPSNYTSTTGNTVVPNMASTGVYTAIATTTGTNPATNTCAVTKTITVVPTPTLTLANNGPVCAGSQANLTANGASSYTWSGPNSFGSNISNPTLPNAQANNGGVYTAVGATNGCTASATTTLTIKPNPTVTASNSGSYCVGQSFSLSALGASSFSWTGPNNFTSASQGPVLTNNVVGYSGTYSVVGTSQGCTATAVTNVTINPLPVIVPATSSANVCAGSNFTLSASGGTSYTWSGPQGFTSVGASVPVSNAYVNLTGTYTVIGTDANGCVSSNTIAQVVTPIPVPVALPSNGCLNDQLTPTASGGTSYQWTGPNGFTSSVQNPTITNVTFADAGVYQVTVTIGGCSATATTNCNVFSTPTVGFLGATEICRGGVFSFLGTGALNYKWLATYGELSQANSFTVSTLSPQLQTTYTLVGADGNGCHNQVVIYPVVLGLPYAEVTADNDGKCVPFSTKFQMSNMTSNITDIHWLFSNGSSANDSVSINYNVGTAGVHTVYVGLTDDRGCKATVSGTVEGYPVPKADFSYTPENPNENDYHLSFTNQTTNAPTVYWYWDFYSNSQATSTKENPSYDFPEIGNYFTFFKVKSNHGCVDSIIKKITVVEDVTFYIPNAFTPNGDGNNDYFMPKAVGVKKYRMDIFDRWGELIFSTSDILTGWDGKHKKGGDLVQQGVYVYKITAILNNGGKAKQYTGHVSLLR